MADPILTHSPTVLGTTDLPASAQSAAGAWTNFGNPLEGEVPVGSETTIMLAVSDLHDPLGPPPGYRPKQTTHIVGIRFTIDGPADSLLAGDLTLDMRNTDAGELVHTGVDNGEAPTAFALGDDCFLVIKNSGSYMDDWSYATVAYVIRVDEAGQPVVVEKKIIQAPSYYCPRRGQLLCIAPTYAWAEAEEYLPRLALVIAQDEFGCFGIDVSPSGFGAKTRYPDPPPSPNDGVLDAWEWVTPGQSLNDDAILAMYYYAVGNTNQWRNALYFPETGVVQDLTNPNGQPTLASPQAEKGDVYTSVDNLYFTWFWNSNRQYMLSGNTLTELNQWDNWGDETNSFNAFDPALQGEINWSDRTWIGDHERRFATFYRYTPRDPQRASLMDIYTNDPIYPNAFPTLEAFRTAVLNAYPTEQAFVDYYNGQGQHAGYFVGFQTGTPTAETTHWAATEVDDVIEDISQTVGIIESPLLGTHYFTVSEASYINPNQPRTIIRWDPMALPPPTAIEAEPILVRRSFNRTGPRPT